MPFTTGISAQSGITTLSGKKCLDLWGQIHFYISSCKGLISAMRKQAIWKEFNGSNVRELSARYGLSIPTVYGLLKDCRNERRTMV
ncbi:Mor transcription activator family protein [Aeromonas caviae]|uniref:Mor transcription activator family protein n=1 Tax=Aeromonas caviae TaxID=648 RepID=UPI003EC6A699